MQTVPYGRQSFFGVDFSLQYFDRDHVMPQESRSHLNYPRNVILNLSAPLSSHI
jgi:hypothetical protein